MGGWHSDNTSAPLSQGAMSGYIFNEITQPQFITHVNCKLAIQSLNASLSNAIYGKSATVQPQATCVQYLIKY